MPVKGKLEEKEKNQNIHVFVRCRPVNVSEKTHGSYSVVDCNPNKGQVVVKERLGHNANTKTFSFDKIFPPCSEQIQVYKSVVSPVIDEVLQGYNCTIFAYGQTGTGKTYTMEGQRSANTNLTWENDPQAGVIPRSLHQIFESLESMDVEYSVRVSFVELYNEELFDLLGCPEIDSQRLRIYDDITRKGSVVIQGLEEVVVRSKDEVYSILERGASRRQTAETLLNATSSRSHSVFSVTIRLKENTIDGQECLKTGKLNLVDLAGSENIGRSGAVHQRAREAGQINQSLLTLGRVITALVEHSPHIPYRESKLTRLLQDSLGGRTKTSIIATVSPASCNVEETLSTLDYAHRAKNIQNRPEVNQKLTRKALMKEYNEEIERLRRDLVAAREKNGHYIAEENYNAMQSKILQQEDAIKELEERIVVLVEEEAKITELFDRTKVTLEVTTNELLVTEADLCETKQVLDVTRQDRDEQTHLVQCHTESENMLHEEAVQLLKTAETSTNHVEGLHQKIARKIVAENHNQQSQYAFVDSFEQLINNMNNNLESHQSRQSSFLDSMVKHIESAMQLANERLGNNADNLASLRGQVQNKTSTQCEQQTETVAETTAWHQDTVNGLHQMMERQETDLNAFKQRINDDITTPSAVIVQEQMEGLDTLKTLLTNQVEGQRSMLEKFLSDQKNMLGELQQVVEHHNIILLKSLDSQKSRAETMMENQSRNFKGLQNQCALLTLGCNSLLKTVTSQNDTLVDFHDSNLQEIDQHRNDMNEMTEDVKHVSCKALANVDTFSDTGSSSLVENEANFNESVSKVKGKANALAPKISDCAQLMNDGINESVENMKLNLQHIEESSNQHRERAADQVNKQLELTKEVGMDVRATLEASQEDINAVQSQLSNTATQDSQRMTEETFVVQQWNIGMHEHTSCQTSTLKLLNDELKKDLPTGNTPIRCTYEYPSHLTKISKHEDILKEYWKRRNLEIEMDEASQTQVDKSGETLSRSLSGSQCSLASDESGSQCSLASDESGSTGSIHLTEGASNTTDQEEYKENKSSLPVPKATRAKGTKQAGSKTPRKNGSKAAGKPKLPLRLRQNNAQ